MLDIAKFVNWESPKVLYFKHFNVDYYFVIIIIIIDIIISLINHIYTLSYFTKYILYDIKSRS